jgi:hypothetical protein
MALYPELPAESLVEKINELAEPEFLFSLDQVLRSQFLIRTVKNLRASDRRAQAAQTWLFPEVQKIAAKLPPIIPIGKKKTVERAKASYEDLQNYLKVMNREDREKHKKRISAVKALMDLWPARTKKNQGTTLAQVDEAKARSAGLI